MPLEVAAGHPSMSGVYIPEIWSGKLLEKFYTATVFGAIANTDYEGEISKYGDKVIIRTVPDIQIKEYYPGMKLDYETPQGATIELNIDKAFGYWFAINSVEQKQSDINYLEKWSDDGGQQLKIVIDRGVLADIYADADTYNKGDSAGKISGNVNLGKAGAPVEVSSDNVIDLIVQCGQVLSEQDVPEDNRWIVIPAWMATAIKTSELKDASLSGDGTSMLRNGRLGVVDRFTIYESNNLSHVTDGEFGGECWNVIAGHKSALTFASQLVENEMLPNPNDFGKIIRGLQVYGYEVIHPESLVHVYVAPVAPASA